MIRSIDGNDGERLVLRAYKTDHLLAGPDPRPIYMLSVTRETLRRGFQPLCHSLRPQCRCR